MRPYQPARPLAVLALLAGLAMPAPSATAAVSPSEPGEGVAPVTRAATRVTAAAMLGDVRNATTNTDYATIQDAIDAATAGDVIEVVSSDHTEGPQIVVDRNLTLRGASGGEVVRPGADTGSSGDARGWFLVDAGVDLTVEDLVFDASGHLVFQAFRHRGGGLFEDCVFRDVRFNESGPTYAGTAIVAFGDPVTVRRTTFSGIGRVGVLFFGAGATGSVAEDNAYTGKGDGDFLDYAFEAGAGAGVTLRRNVVSGNRGVASSDGSTSAGLLVTTFFGAGTTATIESNQLSANTAGLAVGFDGADTSAVDAAFNRVVGNASGVDATSTTVTTVAENDWWGCNGGPGAVGCDTVSGLVDADPWLVLRLLGPAAAPPPVPLTADLSENSDGADVSGLGAFPDGVGIAFAAMPSATLSPPVALTSGGTATSNLSAANGPTTVTATLDNQTVQLAILVQSVVDVPALSPAGLALLLLLLAAAGISALRRRPAR